MTVENISWSISTKECCRPRLGLNPRPPGLQSDGASNWATEATTACTRLQCIYDFTKNWKRKPNAPQRQKTYLRTCAPSEDSDHPAHKIRTVWSKSSPGTFLITKDAKFLQCGQRRFAYVISILLTCAHNEDSDQPAHPRWLIWVFVGRTCQKIRFLTLRIKRFWCYFVFCLFCNNHFISLELLMVVYLPEKSPCFSVVLKSARKIWHDFFRICLCIFRSLSCDCPPAKGIPLTGHINRTRPYPTLDYITYVPYLTLVFSCGV